MKWNGWGEPGRRLALPEPARRLLRERLGEAEPLPSVALEEVKLKRRRSVPEAVLESAGPGGGRTDREARIRHAAGRSYVDLIRLRRGEIDAPDAVLAPPDPGGVAAVLEACRADGVAVVPFGGGTSVVGGIDPVRGGKRAVISLDLSRLRRVRLDRVSLIASLGPGLRGPQAEAALRGHGTTLGHFPQSFECATVGGFAATRSAGQASSGFGRFDEMVTSLRLLAPAGEVRTRETPHSAAGPSLRELALGSEGALGVIAEVAVRVRPVPETRRYEAWIAPDFEQGRQILRELAQAGAMPDVLRLSDEEETDVTLALAGGGGPQGRLLDAYLGLRGRRGGCLVICGWEGARLELGRRRAAAVEILRRGGAVALGPRGGEAWLRGRFEGPYLRDELIDLGYLVETLETAHTWSRLGALYEAVRRALRTALEAQNAPPIVLCHLSHTYRDGASLYFTVIARARPGEEIEQWRAAKAAAGEAIVGEGATITHHHAVGRDHAPYMTAEVGETGVEALRALKERLDPTGIMNPGKLIPAA